MAALATVRGDVSEIALLARAAALVEAQHIESDNALGPLIERGPDDSADQDVYERLEEMYVAGAWVLVESAIADIPADLRWLFESGAVTIEQLAALHEALGVTSIADLADAVERHAIRGVPGLGAPIEEAVGAALSNLRAAVPRIPLGRAVALVDPILVRLRLLPGIEWAEAIGSLRRGQDTVGDLEIVAPTSDATGAIDELSGMPDARPLHRSARKLYLRMDRVQLGIRFPDPTVAGATLLRLTGSAAHLAALQALAAERGWHLDADGLTTTNGAARLAATEAEIYAALGLPLVPAEIRNGDGEIEAALRGVLPELVARTHIRGDLHMHSNYSDGRDAVEDIVRACRDLGYEYMAITDHSPYAASSRNLTADGVKRQAEEIAAVRERYPEIVVLHGCEVDILPDGRLDFPDRILERFDLVLASLHERAGQSTDQLLRRYIAAMRHPLVTAITHPTNRLVPHKPGYALDFDRVFEVAVETNTVVEINGAPVHLDMDGALARRAVAAGVTVAIDSDCHRTDMLDRHMTLGILTARRGWVEPRHVLNTRDIAEVRALVARKHAR